MIAADDRNAEALRKSIELLQNGEVGREEVEEAAKAYREDAKQWHGIRRGGKELTVEECERYASLVAAEEEIITSLRSAGYNKKDALALVGLSESSHHYRHKPRPRVENPIPYSERNWPNKVSKESCEKIMALLTQEFEEGLGVGRIFDRYQDSGGTPLASRRTFYRIAADMRAE
ncbi:hypothetical protein N24_1724 [Corynebacterium suranareeae]|uniref:Uncharacterized protein n=1 Tax=Corynebacterium suranareeae TaxID=2506452 RepID=A0A160PQU2_9CORY|nr:hypothetical protein [Corynebacterium suranareeae]BAU95986.1 hypothetical protein N24_1724 [Corynebacterium suranareeae]